MLNGGPAVEFFKAMAPNPKNALIFVSYQAQGTLGRKVRDGAPEVNIVNRDGRIENIKVNMEKFIIDGFSGHSDRRQLLSFLRNINPRPRNVILNHGEADSIYKFGSLIRSDRAKLGYRPNVYTPSILDSLRVA